MDIAELKQVLLETEPVLQGSTVEWTQLHGGLAHVTYAATVDDATYVVKFLTEEMDEFGLMVPMEHLLHNTIAAGEGGVGARVVSSRPELPVVILEFIEGVTLCTADLSKPEYIPRLGRAVRDLHTKSGTFGNEIDIFRFLDDYLGLVEKHDLDTPPGLLDELGTIRKVQEALAVNALPAVPSNNDLLPLNIMDDGRIRLIDYDFSGMNDPMFDVGDLAMEGDYTPEQTRLLCDSYFGEHVPVQLARARLFSVAAQYTWSLLFVGMGKLLTSAPAETFDYWDEAMSRWKWTSEKLQTPDLGETMRIAAG